MHAQQQQSYVHHPVSRWKLRNGTSSSGPPPSVRAVPLYNVTSKPLQNGPSGVATGRDSKQFVPCAPASNGFSAPPPFIRSRACSVDAPAPFILPSVPASLASAVRPPASIQAAPPPPPPARRKNSANQRSQRAGFTSDEQGVPLERAANAAPKLIHINSPGSRTSGGPPSLPTSPYGAQPVNVKCHPPPPPPPVSATQTPTITTLSVDFGRRFRFLSDAELPPPPEAYKGPHTYRTGANRTAPRRPLPVPTGNSLRS
ncbi:hypothetical protein CSKR_111413 [Clonorchis sinensis]|uniref:Uncharacterized protein n=1 Tax=Clonorchis sinensis TaxID=79923 RepID=A0A8T1LX80_CLOSI|nr:hypothetical protein CSKR_111413 [Clonorchis sinensis]